MARTAVLGMKAHTGWAAAVAITKLEVVAKARIEMATDFEEAGVYHAGAKLSLAKAEALIRDREKRFGSSATKAIAAIARDLENDGITMRKAAIVAGAGKPLPPLSSILRSHALINTAEGELFRRILADAGEVCGLSVAFVPLGALRERAARAAEVSEKEIDARITRMGKASGRPWAKDQKECALAALALGS